VSDLLLHLGDGNGGEELGEQEKEEEKKTK
jgi:hypothetical protein